jgi:small subunit ribosomal protein S6
MPLYEHVFLARQDISAQQVEALLETFKSVITEHEGTVSKSEYWGLRSLAYRIKKKRKAHYALMNIDAPHAAVAEMERRMRIEGDVIRFLTLRVDEHEDEPSVMMKRQDRDDRRGPRGDRDDNRRGPRGDRDDNRRGPRAAPEKPAAEKPASDDEKPAAAEPAEAAAEPTESDAT